MKIILILLFCLSIIQAGDKGWTTSYKKALEKAKKAKKGVYMLITSDTCKWCKKFKSKTLIDNSVIEKLKEKYILLQVSRDSNFIPEIFNIKRVPRHYFLTDKGESIYTFLGYWNVPDFMSFLPGLRKKKIKDVNEVSTNK